MMSAGRTSMTRGHPAHKSAVPVGGPNQTMAHSIFLAPSAEQVCGARLCGVIEQNIADFCASACKSRQETISPLRVRGSPHVKHSRAVTQNKFKVVWKFDLLNVVPDKAAIIPEGRVFEFYVTNVVLLQSASDKIRPFGILLQAPDGQVAPLPDQRRHQSGYAATAFENGSVAAFNARDGLADISSIRRETLVAPGAAKIFNEVPIKGAT